MEAAGATKRGTGKPRRLRRQYIVNPRFQWKYTGLAALAVFIVSVAMGVTVYLIQFREAQARLLSPAWPHAQENTLVIVLVAAAFAMVMAAGFAVWSVFLTHRICGPLFVIGRCFDTLIAGRFPKRRPLRTKDEFGEFCGHFWRAVDAMSARKQAEIDSLTQILRAVRSAAETDAKARTQHLNTVDTLVTVLLDESTQALGLPRDNVAPPPMTNKQSHATRVPQHAESLN